MACIFCDIAQGRQDARIVYEDDMVRGFYDIHPKAPVHLLFVPKIHIESIAHLKEEDGSVIVALVFAAKKVAEQQGLIGYKLMWNVGPEAGQVVPHLHLHLLAGTKDALSQVSAV